MLGSPLRDGSRGGCGARPALLPRLLLFLLLLRAPVRPSRSAHGKRPPPRAAARPPAREGPPARPRRRTPGAQGGGLGPRRVGRSARAGHGPAARVTGPPSCRAWRREGSRRDEARWTAERRPPRSRPPGLRLGSPLHGSAGPPERRALLGRASLSGGDSPSVLCTLSAGVWRRPDLLTTQTHSTLQARAEPIAMASRGPAFARRALLCGLTAFFLVKGMSPLCHTSPVIVYTRRALSRSESESDRFSSELCRFHLINRKRVLAL